MIAQAEAERLRKAHSDFERARGRVWVERVRVGLDYRRAMRKIDEDVAQVRIERDGLVRKAVAAGASYREVARALGLSHSRIQQIVNSPSK
jgi:DNA invertase Pin-like site-specific DNA recombinase